MATSDSDRQLLQNILADNDQAWRQLVDRHEQSLLEACWFGFGRLGREDIEDAVQEAFTTLCRKMNELAGRCDNLRAWLLQVAINGCLNRARKADRQRTIAESQIAITGDSPLGLVQSRSENPLLVHLRYCIDELDEASKIFVASKVWGALSQSDLTRLFRMTLHGIKRRTKELWRRLKECVLKKAENDPHCMASDHRLIEDVDNA
jgi:RNA polymerase sigma factor (sigma-70 family)